MAPRGDESMSACVTRASLRRPDLLVIDALTPDIAVAALAAAGQGVRVLAAMDCALRGAHLAQHLLLWGVQAEQLNALSWVISVQRLATLCPTCRRADRLDAQRAHIYRTRLSGFDDQATYSVAPGGAECNGTGRKGDVSIFDIFHATVPVPALFSQPSQLAAGQYALSLAAQGYLALDDVLEIETGQLGRLQHLLESSQRAYAENNHALRLKLLELETSNRVLQQRTEALISLERLGSELIGSGSLEDIGRSVCRYAKQLCGAGRAILYVLQPVDTARVLAVNGWSDDLLGTSLAAEEVLGASQSAEPAPFANWPPGVPHRDPDLEGARLYLGLRVPLVAQEKLVGLLIVHPTTKPRFNQGEVALLRTLANQAALAIQRAELVDDLRARLIELQTAQEELVQKERLERELELARTVQQSLLPRSFPTYAGYRFAARCIPAREVGGDFYDVFALDAQRFGIVIADVSDKGMPSALFMALTRSLLLAEAERERSPRAVLENVNRLLLALAESEMFVTLFYGVVDTHEQTLTYTRAGHDRPMLLRAGVAASLGGTGLVLGQLDSSVLGLTEEQVRLQPGDRLVLFTDGLTDIRDPQEAMYGHARLISFFRVNANAPADGLCEAVFGELAAYRADADQYDDMTLLVVQVD
jgi:serine phosphatase RsbU (regulator of sigma subunit)